MGAFSRKGLASMTRTLRRNLARNLTKNLLVIAGIALGGAAFVSTAQAEQLARIRGVGVESAISFPLGEVSKVMEPALSARVSLQWPIWADRVAAGFVGGWERESGAIGEVPHASLTTKMAAVRVQSLLGPRHWGTLPYASLDVGMAWLTLKVKSNVVAESDDALISVQETRTTNTSGLLLAPEVGLWTTLSYGLSLKVSVRYQHVMAQDSLAFGDIRTDTSSDAGFGLGVYYRFE